MFTQLSVQGMQAPAGQVHVLWAHCAIQSRQLQPQARCMGRCYSGLRSRTEEAFQPLVDESTDHGTVYRHAIQRLKEIQNRFVRPRALRDYLVDLKHISRTKYVRQLVAAWRVEAGLMRTVATAAPRRSFDIANCDIKSYARGACRL
jgi:hypothetical protein